MRMKTRGHNWGQSRGLHPCGETRKLGTGSCTADWGRGIATSVAGKVRFKLGGWSIGERRVQAVAIVDLLEEGADRRAGVVDVAVGSPVNLLVLERLHEALRLGIVIGAADATHARLDLMRDQDVGVVSACVLHAAI